MAKNHKKTPTNEADLSCSFRIEEAVVQAASLLRGAYATLEYESNKSAALTLIHLAQERMGEMEALVEELYRLQRDNRKALGPSPGQPSDCAREE